MNATFAPRALALAATLCALGAQAQTSPYAFGVSETLSQESNPLRTRNALAESEMVSTTALDFLLDQHLGRQRLKANAELALQRFSDTKAWNNNPYRLGAELDWSTVNHWEGELGVDTGQELYRFDQNSGEPARNEQRSTRAWLRARVGVITTWTFEAGLTGYERDLSLASFDRLDQRQWAAEAGLRYRYNPDLGGRLMLRHTDGEYPRYSSLGADEFRRNDLELSADWQLTGASLVNASITWASEDHTQQDSRSANLWAGSVRWVWMPTGKLTFTTSLQRDSDVGASRFGSTLSPGSSTGSGTTTSGATTVSTSGTSTDTGSGLGAAGSGLISADETTDARLATTLGLAAHWAATAKVSFDASARYTRRDLQSDSSAGSSQRGNDDTAILALGVRYSPSRAIDLGCSVSREHRSTSSDSLSLSFPYGNTVVSCFGQLWLR